MQALPSMQCSAVHAISHLTRSAATASTAQRALRRQRAPPAHAAVVHVKAMPGPARLTPPPPSHTHTTDAHVRTCAPELAPVHLGLKGLMHVVRHGHRHAAVQDGLHSTATAHSTAQHVDACMHESTSRRRASTSSPPSPPCACLMLHVSCTTCHRQPGMVGGGGVQCSAVARPRRAP